MPFGTAPHPGPWPPPGPRSRQRLGPDLLHGDQAGTDLAGNVEGTGVRRRHHAATEPVDGVVGQPDRVLVVARVGHHREHRAEDLLLGDAQVVGAHEDGRLVEVALLEPLGPLATAEQLGSLFEPRRHVALDALALLLADEGAEHGALVAGVADRDQRAHRVQALLVGVEQPFGQQDAGVQHTALAAVREHLPEADGAGVVLGDVAQHDRRALAAELQLDPLHGARGRGHDPPPGGGRAGEGDHVDHGVRRQLVAHLAVPGDDVEHAGWDSGFGGGLGDHHGVERRPGVRLEDHRAADGERRCHLHHVEHEREVERRDGGDHADGLAHECAARHSGGPAGRHVVLDPGEGVLGDGGVRAQHPDRPGPLHAVGEEARRPGLGDDQLPQVPGPRLRGSRPSPPTWRPAPTASCRATGPRRRRGGPPRWPAPQSSSSPPGRSRSPLRWPDRRRRWHPRPTQRSTCRR